jgi:hypothetical protein
MRVSFEYGTKAELKLVYTLLRREDEELSEHLEGLCEEVTAKQLPIFCISWLLTWFAHDLFKYETICRVFDFVLASHSLAPLYLTVQVLIQLKPHLIQIEDLGTLHKFVGGELDSLDWEEVIARAHVSMSKSTPQMLCELASPPFLPE